MRKVKIWLLKRLLRNLGGRSRYIEHCRRELATWFAEDQESPDRWIANHMEELLCLFAIEGHSGSSAPFAIKCFSTLAALEPWGPLTGDDAEWTKLDYGEDMHWQNKRCSRVFKDADGRAYDIDGKVFREPSGCCYTNRGGRVYIEFPYQPTTEYVDVAA